MEEFIEENARIELEEDLRSNRQLRLLLLDKAIENDLTVTPEFEDSYINYEDRVDGSHVPKNHLFNACFYLPDDVTALEYFDTQDEDQLIEDLKSKLRLTLFNELASVMRTALSKRMLKSKKLADFILEYSNVESKGVSQILITAICLFDGDVVTRNTILEIVNKYFDASPDSNLRKGTFSNVLLNSSCSNNEGRKLVIDIFGEFLTIVNIMLRGMSLGDKETAMSNMVEIILHVKERFTCSELLESAVTHPHVGQNASILEAISKAYNHEIDLDGLMVIAVRQHNIRAKQWINGVRYNV